MTFVDMIWLTCMIVPLAMATPRTIRNRAAEAARAHRASRPRLHSTNLCATFTSLAGFSGALPKRQQIHSTEVRPPPFRQAQARQEVEMKIHSKDFCVAESEKVDLKKRPTTVDPFYGSKDDYQEMLADHVAEMSELQQLLYASHRYALLLIFQAMDAAGKDGAIKHVMSGVNPQGCQVFSFKHPSDAELQHDFLWRTTRDLPERGRIGIFNRSYYEEVLIVRVHPEILRNEALADPPRDRKEFWHGRYRSIVNLERHLHANGTRIVKFFLHLSKEEQRKRFLARIDDAEKNWKFSLADVEERKFWKEYRTAYEGCLGATSTRDSPWYVVPADDKLNARLIVSRIILDTLEELKMSYPKTDDKRRRELQAIRKELS
jgi:PPK2 family polyphosphate:nucleotide phosphotransferase